MSGLVMRLRKTWQSVSLRAIATLMGGNFVAMAVPILAAPVLGRLYLPADYGALAQYMAPAAVLAVLASLQFQHAIIAERTDRGAGTVAWLGFLSALALGFLTAFAVALLWEGLFSRSSVGLWFTVLPLSVVGAGLVVTGQFLANRHRLYRAIATIQLTQVLSTVALSISLGFQGWSADGLLLAYFLGQAMQVIAYMWLLIRLPYALCWPGLARLRVLIRRHWKFPAFTLPSEFLGQLNMHVPIFVLAVLGADSTIGAFVRARQLVSIPVTVLGQAVAQVFRRDASQLYSDTGSCRALMLSTAGWLFTIGFIPCILLMALAPRLFEWYLGPTWREAGEIARVLAPMLLIRMAVSPITTVFSFTGHQKLNFYLILFGTVLLLPALILSAYYFQLHLFFIIYSVIYSIIYSAFFISGLAIASRSIEL